MSDPVSMADLFYSDDEPVLSAYEPSLTDSMNLLRDSTGMSEAESEKLQLETAHFFHAANINPGFAQKLHGQIVQHLQRPPDDPTFNEWQTESRRGVRERYPDDGDKRTQLANEYVASYPTVAKQMTDSGMGSRPELFLALVDRAYALRPKRK
jgi:hypothetical protein